MKRLYSPLSAFFRALACTAAHSVRCTMQDVGTVDSGLNSTVLASNNEMVILPVNEPTFGTRRKSQIQVCAKFLRLANLQLRKDHLLCLQILL